MPATLVPPVATVAPVRYLTLADGSTFIPVGPNLCFPRFITDEAQGLALYRDWIDRLATHGGNFLRLWLGHPFFDLEPDHCGDFSESRATRLRHVLDLAAANGIRVKLTLEHFRFIDPQPVAEIFPGAARFDRPQLHRSRGGPAADMADYLGSAAGRAHFLEKLDWLAARFRDHPAIFAWELWNEMNAVKADNWRTWTAAMLPELRNRFPDTLCLQSLGSHDCAERHDDYRWFATHPDTTVVQIHRYLDLAPAAFDVCRGPVDIMAASAIRDARALAPEKPALLAESGAVEPAHSAPSRLYATDHEGVILHDVLFAAFFAGAAGPGQIWHWDIYLARHDLWHHYRAFRTALEGIHPAAENFTPLLHESPSLRTYELRGRTTRLFWLRDTAADWRAELRDGIPAATRHDDALNPGASPAHATWAFLDPWSASPAWRPLARPDLLPPWRRSLLLRATVSTP